MKQSNNQTIKQSFALVYVLVFTMIVLMAIAMVVGNVVTNLTLQSSSRSSIQAYNLARTGIDVGWAKYRDLLDENEDANITINPYTYFNETDLYTATGNIYQPYLNELYPTTVAGHTACASTEWAVHRTFVNGTAATDTYFIYGDNTGIDFGGDGAYDYSICYNGTTKIIRAVGYYQSTKVALQAKITHVIPTSTDLTNPNSKGDRYSAYYDRWAYNGCIINLITLNCDPQYIEGHDYCGIEYQEDGTTPLPLCTSRPLPNDDPTRPMNLTHIQFNHQYDKLEISQIGI
jgi:hypothetical protein